MKKIMIVITILLGLMLVSCNNSNNSDNQSNTYVIKFYSHDNEMIKTIYVNENIKIQYPEAPVIEGYDFVRWSTDIEYANSDLNIYGIYQAKSYTVKFYNHLNEVISTQTVYYDRSATAPTIPNISGYEFVRWDTDFSNVKSDLDIKPIYQEEIFVVKFYDELGNVISEQELKRGESATAPILAERDNYIFIGWDKTFTNVTSNLDIKPIYQEEIFIVKFYDGFDNVISEQELKRGESAIAPDEPYKEGRTFIGWDTDFINVSSNLDVKPLYTLAKYIVKFYDANGDVIKEQQVYYSASATAPINPTKTGYNFVKWDTDFSSVKSNLDVKPIFELAQYTVNFYDAEGTLISTQQVYYGYPAVEPAAPSKDGATFMGWDTDCSKIEGDSEIYPVFDDIYYEVSFVDMRGNLIEVQSIKAHESAIAPNPPIEAYYTFSKWDIDYSCITKDLVVKALYIKDTTNYQMSDVNYWLQILVDKYDIKKTILTKEQIENYNTSILSDFNKTKVIDVTTIASTTTSTNVSTLINKYTNINKYTVYNASTNSALSTAAKEEILNNRNLSNIATTVTVRYGIVTDFAWVRSYPTNHYSNNYSMDRFQETSLNVAEGVAIYHESLDGKWYFVQAQNYSGWVEKQYIATCSYDEMKNFLKEKNRLVVIADYVTIEESYVRMGQSFPLINTTDTLHTITFPMRNTDGTLNLKNITVSNNNSYSNGFLDYNYENLFKQAFKLLGIDYSWGDKEKTGRDCSSTMNAVYHTFGFTMPRNTSNQVAIPNYSTSVNGITVATMQNYHPGTMIFTSSHVMMYIGEDKNGVSYLLHNTTSGDGACILQSLSSYGTSKIIGILEMQ